MKHVYKCLMFFILRYTGNVYTLLRFLPLDKCNVFTYNLHIEHFGKRKYILISSLAMVTNWMGVITK
jgi:hypothetical protein